MNKESNTPKKVTLKASDHENYNSYSILAFLIPLVGIIIGAVYMTKDEPLDNKLGENMIAFGVFGMIVGAILWSMLVGQGVSYF